MFVICGMMFTRVSKIKRMCTDDFISLKIRIIRNPRTTLVVDEMLPPMLSSFITIPKFVPHTINESNTFHES